MVNSPRDFIIPLEHCTWLRSQAAAGTCFTCSEPCCVLCCVSPCRPLDVFFVLLLGPYCLVSSTSHSTQHHHWGWHLKLPLAEPAETLTLVSARLERGLAGVVGICMHTRTLRC
jgi:hypothetical protein